MTRSFPAFLLFALALLFSSVTDGGDQGTLTSGGETALTAGGRLIDNQNGIDWNESQESSMSTGNLSFNLGTLDANGNFNANNPWYGTDGRRTGVNFEGGGILGQGTGFFGSIGSQVFGPGTFLGGAFDSAGQSAYSSLLNGLLYSPEGELENVWNNAAFSGVSAFGGYTIGHGPLEGIWQSSHLAQWTARPSGNHALMFAVSRIRPYGHGQCLSCPWLLAIVTHFADWV